MISFILACFPCGILIACARPSPPLYAITIAGHTVQVELAITDEERSLGLMFRDALSEESGMLFVFDRPGPYSFWMKNTYIPLAIAFIDSEGIIVNIEEMQAHNEKPVYPRAYILYALEMNAGWFAQKNITPGMRINFDDTITKQIRRCR
jgi:uncharacterized membrane protein (UPF0127 family)